MRLPPPARRTGIEARKAVPSVLLVFAAALLGLIALVTSAHQAAAQPADPTLHVSADTVEVGERFIVAISVPHEPAQAVQFPRPTDASAAFGDLEVIDRGDVHEYPFAEEPGLQVDSVTYEVTTFALDQADIPPLPVRLLTEDDTTTATTEGQTISVRSAIAEEDEGLRDPASIAEFPRSPWLWVGGVLAALAILGLLYYQWQRREPRNTTGDDDSDVSPYEAATEQLDRLADAPLHTPESVQSFYADLADALRTYLARRGDLPALERTTSELMRELDASPLSRATKERLRTLLQKADLVKFADARPAASDCRESLETARALLDQIASEVQAAEEDARESGKNGQNEHGPAASSEPGAARSQES